MASLVPPSLCIQMCVSLGSTAWKAMITFGQTSMKRDGWTTGVPLNTEFVAGCSHGTMPAHMCGPSHTPGTHTHTHTHTIVFANGQSASHTQPLFLLLHLFTQTIMFLLVLILPSCPEATHNCCHVPRPHTPSMLWKRAGVHERGRGGEAKKKKSLSNSKCQRGHRNSTQSQSGSHGDKCGSVQWGWERVMKERERGKGQGKSRRRAGCWRQGSVGGYWGGSQGGKQLHSKGQWEVWWCRSITVLEHSSTPPLIFLPSCSSW